MSLEAVDDPTAADDKDRCSVGEASHSHLPIYKWVVSTLGAR